jgi:hypothetical protein
MKSAILNEVDISHEWNLIVLEGRIQWNAWYIGDEIEKIIVLGWNKESINTLDTKIRLRQIYI